MKFGNAILAALTLLVASLVVPSVLLVRHVLESQAQADLRRDLERSALVFEELTGYRATQLETQLRVTAEEPRVKAVVATGVEHATALDAAIELKGAMNSDLFLLTDGDGVLIADTRNPEAHGFDLKPMALVSTALRAGASTGIWSADGVVYQAAGRRMAFGEVVVGVLLVGYAIDNRVVQTIQRQTGSSVLIQLAGKVSAAAVNDDGPDSATLALASAGLGLGGPHELRVGDERFLAITRRMPGYTGQQALTYTIVRSLDRALVASRALISWLTQIAGIAILVAIALGVLLSRMLTRPLDRLVAFTAKIAAGATDVRAEHRGAVEIRTLAEAMNKMAADLARSRSALQHNNESLERTIEARTQHLRVANTEIAEMLDHLEDAVMTVNAEFIIEPRCSPACARILGVDAIAGFDIRDLLFSTDRVETSDAQLSTHVFALETSFGCPVEQWEANNHLVLGELRYRHPAEPATTPRTFSLRYAPLYDRDHNIERIMIMASDVSEMLALRTRVETEQRRASARVDALLALMACTRQEALQFVDDNVARIARVNGAIERWERAADPDAVLAVFRELHTIKGNASALRFAEIADRTHAAEDVIQALIAEAGAPGTPPLASRMARLRAAATPLQELLTIYADVANEVLRGHDPALHVDLGRLRARVEAIAGADGPATAARLGSLLELVTDEATERVSGVQRLFHQQRPMIEDISHQLGKQVTLTHVEGGELFVAAEVAPSVRDAFNHAIRNALDHGIEPATERARLGKPPVATLALAWTRDDHELVVRLSDDGAGIDLAHVTQIARAKGLLADTATVDDAHILELLFEPGFSTRPTVTDLSGRGVGLDAIRSALAAHGIRVALHSRAGQGTTLEVRLPIALARWEERDHLAERIMRRPDVAAA
jgi:signal transduction histidine kinase